MSILEDRNPQPEHFDYTRHYTPDDPRRPLAWNYIEVPVLRMINSATYQAGGTPYGLAALAKEHKAMAATVEGERNNQLLGASGRIGQLIGGGVLGPEVAILSLAKAAEQAGLGTEEIAQTMLRSGGGVEYGLGFPRNELGFLKSQYLTSAFPAEVLDCKVYLGALDDWKARLNFDGLSITTMTIISQFEGLGVLYLHNYLYFLAQIHQAVLRNVSGTGIALSKLTGQYAMQADDREKELLKLDIPLRMVLANLPAASVVTPGQIADAEFLHRIGFEPPDEWFPADSLFKMSQPSTGGVEDA